MAHFVCHVPILTVALWTLFGLTCLAENRTPANIGQRAIPNGPTISYRAFYLKLEIHSQHVVGGVCGGSLIHPRAILTSAQCIQGTDNGDAIRVVDLSYWGAADMSQWADRWIHHEGNEYQHDIAIVFLKLKTRARKFRTIPRCKQSQLEIPLALCWMRESTGEYTPRPSLETRVVETGAECGTKEFDVSTQICLEEDSTGNGPCYGASGSPLFTLPSTDHPDQSDEEAGCLYGMFGLLSHNSNCKEGTILYRVSAYKDWIDAQIRDYIVGSIRRD